MPRIVVFFASMLLALGLCAQEKTEAPKIDASDSLIFRLNGGELYRTLMRPTSEPVFWFQAGEAEFALILDLNDEGKVIAVESFAFGGGRKYSCLQQKGYSTVILGCN